LQKLANCNLKSKGYWIYRLISVNSDSYNLTYRTCPKRSTQRSDRVDVIRLELNRFFVSRLLDTSLKLQTSDRHLAETLTFQCLKDELICQSFFLLRLKLDVRQASGLAITAYQARVSSAGATFRLAGLVSSRSWLVNSAADERFIRVLHCVEKRRRVAEHLVIVEARLVLEEAEDLSTVFFGRVLTRQTEAELAVAVRETIVGDAVEERVFGVGLFFFRQQLVITAVTHYKHLDAFGDVSLILA